LVSIENIILAWKKFKKGKSNKIDVQEFQYNFEDNILLLHEQLTSGDYKHGKYRSFYLNDPKQRHIHKASVSDRIIHHILADYLESIYERKFVFTSYSCRKNKGTHTAVSRFYKDSWRLSRNNSRKVWVLKCDIKKFFENISLLILKSILQTNIKDIKILNLLNAVIDSFNARTNFGLPLGNVTSQWFANIYLNELDQYAKRRLKIKKYFRYGDDFIIVDINIENLYNNLRDIGIFLKNKLDLTLHKRKVKICNFDKGVDFLGFTQFPHYRILRTKTKRRIFRKAELLRQKIGTDKFRSSFASYLGISKHFQSYNFKKRLIYSLFNMPRQEKPNKKRGDDGSGEKIITTTSGQEKKDRLAFLDLESAEEYLDWKKTVPESIRRIVEPTLKGMAISPDQRASTDVDTTLVARFLDALKQKINDPSFDLSQYDPRIQNLLVPLDRIGTREGFINVFEALKNPDTSWALRKKLYQLQLAPSLEWLSEIDLQREIKELESILGTESPASQWDDANLSKKDAASSMEQGLEKVEGEPKAHYLVKSFWGGYYKRSTHARLNRTSLRWEAREDELSEWQEREKIDPTRVRILSSYVIGGEITPIPLPYDWTIDPDSLNVENFDGEAQLIQNQDGIWHLKTNGEGKRNYRIKIGKKIVAPPEILMREKIEIGISLPQELKEKIAEARKNNLQPVALARFIVRLIRDRLNYSNDPNSFKRYIQSPDKFFEELWEVKDADCFVSNTLAVAALIEAGLNTRFVSGYFVKEKNKDGDAVLHSGNGHAWLEVWDQIGQKWVRLDATPKGDPTMDEATQDKDLSGDTGEGDFGEDEIMSEEKVKEQIKEIKKKGGGKGAEKKMSDIEEERFAETAECTPAEAKQFLMALERVRQIKDKDGVPIVELLKDLWRKIVEERRIEVSEYRGPVRMDQGDRLEDPVSASIDLKAREYNPTGFEKDQRVEKIKFEFGGINIFFSFDLSGSMASPDASSGRSKADVQRDTALLFIDALMQCAIISRREDNPNSALPVKIMVTVASSVGDTKLPLTDKWGPREQWAFYSALNKTASGGTPTHQSLRQIEIGLEKEIRELEKLNLPTDKLPIHYVVEITDGVPDDLDATLAAHARLKSKGASVRSYLIGGDVSPEEYGEDASPPISSFSDLPKVLSDDIINVFKKLRPSKISS